MSALSLASKIDITLPRSAVVSMGIHIALLLLLPGLAYKVSPPPRTLLEVELFRPPSLTPPPALPAPSPPSVPVKKAKPAPAKKGSPGWDVLPTSLAKGKVTQHQGGAPLPEVTLPLETGFEKPKLPFWVGGEPLPLKKVLGPQTSTVPELEAPPAPSLPRPELEITAPQINSPGVGATEIQEGISEITWSGPPRQPLHRPSIPRYSSQVAGDVQLKFWVDARGAVTSVDVLKKLDAELEQLAIDFMRRWRFEPLRAGYSEPKPKKLQWGVITIRFKLD